MNTTGPDTLKMAATACAALEDKKGKNITVIDISEISTLADYFIIANGENLSQVHAMADFVEEKLGKDGYHPVHLEGYQSGRWILMDYQDLVVHIFSKEDRQFYDLERIWRDGKQIDPASLNA